jgi:hypothetical protein
MSVAQPINQFHFRIRASDVEKHDGRILVICLHDRVCENKQAGFDALPSCGRLADSAIKRRNNRL